ncbi:hypothetical protein B0H19DRAFT_1146120 [Mycena capillaripes]|nr:hypothetical protein B0H19DRAFT_1146120 [Mycena capillaripes]
MSQGYSLLVQSLDGFSWKPGFLHQKEPNLYVGIDLDESRVRQTHTINRDLVPKWNDVYALSSDQLSARLSLHVYHKSSRPLTDDSCLATVDISIRALQERCGTLGTSEQVVALELVKKDKRIKSAGTLAVRLAAIGIIEGGKTEVTSAQKAVEGLVDSGAVSGAMGAVDTVAKVQSKAGDIESSLGVLISKIDIIVRLGDKLAAIHPYANVAWKVLTSVYQAVKQQRETDKKIVELVGTMVTTFSFVEDIESLPEKIEGLEHTCLAIVKQTVECAIFIREYAGKGFGGRLTAQALSDKVPQQIADLSKALNALKQEFDNRLGIHTAFVCAAIKENVQSLTESDQLKALHPVDMNAALRTKCLTGTRIDILNFIQEWLTTPSDSSNIIWLYGVAGSGKSTISTTVSEYFRHLGRLGAFIFFDRNDRVASHPSAVIRTIANQLANSDPTIRAAICDALKHDPKVATATMETQFEKLLLVPLKVAQTHINGPIIVVMDALDECGDAESRRGLVSLLSNEFHKLPPIFRFLITSRPDSDIADHFRDQSSIIKMQLETSITADIRLYIRSRMEEIRKQRKLEDQWPGNYVIKTLTEYSDGLFIWASTATKFLEGHGPKQKLEFLMKRDPTAGFSLDQLFKDALGVAGSWGDPDFASDARAVLGAIVLGKVPMTDAMIDTLFNFDEDRASRHILSALACVVQWSPGKEARTLHASFGDYLTDPQRSSGQPWHLDVKAHHCALTLGCFGILKKELRFNICMLEDSYVENSNVPNLSAVAKTYISSQLSYASRFWADHLTETKYEGSIQEELLQFLQNRFLFWLEVVSISQAEAAPAVHSFFEPHASISQPEAAPAVHPFFGRSSARSIWSSFHLEDVLNSVLKGIPKGGDDDLRNLTEDYILFIRFFETPIMEAALHIYLSALAMAPEQSLVGRQYSPQFRGIVKLTAGAVHSWEDAEKNLAIGAKTLQSINKPVPAHWARAVAFSPDGSRVAWGSACGGTVCIQEKTGQPLGEPRSEIWSVADSPYGSPIVLGSGEGTLRIRNTETWKSLGEPFRSVAVSPIASDSSYGTFETRQNTETRQSRQSRQSLGESLRRYRSKVWSVAASPDGSHIVSGKNKSPRRVGAAGTRR